VRETLDSLKSVVIAQALLEHVSVLPRAVAPRAHVDCEVLGGTPLWRRGQKEVLMVPAAIDACLAETSDMGSQSF
jgi:hypothetical protein